MHIRMHYRPSFFRRICQHLANRSAYEYTAEQVEAMFGALENKVADVKAKFSTKKQDNTSFSFGTHAE